MMYLYLILAILGGVVPYLFFFQFFGSFGLDLPEFISALFVNGAAGGFSADLLITSLVFWIYIFQQQRNNDGPQPVLFIAMNLLIGLSCALPAYLFVRERAKSPS